jgi:hypothetical protein
MKFLQWASLSIFMVAPAFGSQVVLIQKVGAIANSTGRADICEIHSHHPELKGVDIAALAAAAAKEPLQKSLHVVAQIPSEEIFVRNNKSTLLLHWDYSDKRTRSGKASQELIELTEKLCK